MDVICAAQLRQRDEEIPATLLYLTASDAEGCFEGAENRINFERAIQERAALAQQRTGALGVCAGKKFQPEAEHL